MLLTKYPRFTPALCFMVMPQSTPKSGTTGFVLSFVKTVNQHPNDTDSPKFPKGKLFMFAELDPLMYLNTTPVIVNVTGIVKVTGVSVETLTYTSPKL